MNLLAKSCFAPGLISCMSNLFASAGAVDIDSFNKEWLKEYANGMGHEIYRVQIQENEFFSPTPLTFKKIAEICYTEYSAVIFALEIEPQGHGRNKSKVILNPSLFEFKDWINYNYFLYIICEDESLATQVQMLEMPDEKYVKYMGRQRTEKLRQDVIVEVDGDHSLSKEKIVLKKDHVVDEEAKQSLMGLPDPSSRMSAHRRRSHAYNTSRSSVHKQSKKPDEPPKPKKQNTLERDYDILAKPKMQTEVLIKDKKIKLQNHIVVCGLHSSIYHFILPLRAKYLKSYQQDIVIISNYIDADIWEGIASFPRVFLVEGSPISTDILKQAYIHKADKAVIMGYDPSFSNEAGQKKEINDQMIDARTIFIHKVIKKLNPSLQIFSEISFQSNIDFILPKTRAQENFNFSSLFAAGEVYIASTIDTLTAQAFYNPHIVTITQQILVGTSELQSGQEEEAEEALARKFGDKLQQSNMWQILVPEEFVN